jgi:hypothetical protein
MYRVHNKYYAINRGVFSFIHNLCVRTAIIINHFFNHVLFYSNQLACTASSSSFLGKETYPELMRSTMPPAVIIISFLTSIHKSQLIITHIYHVNRMKNLYKLRSSFRLQISPNHVFFMTASGSQFTYELGNWFIVNSSSYFITNIW